MQMHIFLVETHISVFDPLPLEGVWDKFCRIHPSDDAPDMLAAMQQSVKWQKDRLRAQLHRAV